MAIVQKKPEWLKTKYNEAETNYVVSILERLKLNTVCGEANCPNLGECFKKNTATFMIMGSQCTRNCRFCNVTHGEATPLDDLEPQHLAEAVAAMGLKHVVITSVTRDDLPDGGATHFAKTIEAVRSVSPDVTIEVLIPDLKGEESSLDIIIQAKPEIINHNIETVKELYDEVRPEANYERSLFVLDYCKKKAPDRLTKTGIMVGLGETEEQVLQTMDDLRHVGCDIFTIGQYLRPTKEHLAIKEYITPQQFEHYKKLGEQKGFLYVASAPLVRSSYNASEAIVAWDNLKQK